MLAKQLHSSRIIVTGLMILRLGTGTVQPCCGHPMALCQVAWGLQKAPPRAQNWVWAGPEVPHGPSSVTGIQNL